MEDEPSIHSPIIKVAQVKSIDTRPQEIKEQEKRETVSIRVNNPKMIEEVSSSESNESFQYECNFIPNVF